MKGVASRVKGYFTQSPEGRYLGAVLVIALVVFSILLALPTRLIEPDDATYYVAMKAFAQGKLVITRSELMDLTREVMDKGLAVGNSQSVQYVPAEGGYALEKAPGYPVILALFYRLGIEKAVNLVFGIAALWAFYRLLSRAFNHRVAFLSSLILLSNATFLAMFYRTYMSDFVSMALVLLGMVFYYFSLEGGRWWEGVAAGLFLSAAVAVRYTNVVAYAAVLVHSLWLMRKDKKVLRHLAVVLTASLPIGLALAAYNWALFGSPFTVGYSKTIGYTNFAFQYILKGDVTEGLRLLWRNLLTHPRLLFEGFPSLVLLPAGAYISRKNRVTPLMLLWFLAYFGLYFQYEWLRTGLYIFMTRFYLPMAPVVAAFAGVAIEKLLEGGKETRAVGYTLLAFILLVNIASFAGFLRFALSPAPGFVPGPSPRRLTSGQGRGAPPGPG